MRNLIYIFLLIPFLTFGQYPDLLQASLQQNSGTPIDLPSLYIKLTPDSVDATATVEDDAV